MALVDGCTGGEAGLCEVNDGELEESAGFVGESVHNGEGSNSE